MDVSFAVLADYSNVSTEGKLNIMGIFDHIWAKSFPSIHPYAQLIMRFECGPAEFGTQKDIKIVILDEDGAQISSLDGKINIDAEQKRPHVKVDHSLRIQNMRFESPGQYAISILVSGEEKISIPLTIEQLPAESKGDV